MPTAVLFSFSLPPENEVDCGADLSVFDGLANTLEDCLGRLFLAVAALHVAAVWIIHRILQLHGWLAWGADVLGSVAASLLALWLFLPVAAAIGTMYLERIAIAVERRFYPWLPPPDGATFLDQAWDGMVIAVKVLCLNIIALILALLLPGAGLLLGWMIAAYAIGRGLFVAVAMRRMPRVVAELLYRTN